MIVSCSNGNLSHLVTDDTGELVVEQAWKAHDYEPWITAFDLWRPEVVWSGKTQFWITAGLSLTCCTQAVTT